MTTIKERYKQAIIIKSSVNHCWRRYVLKNVNYSNPSRVRKRIVKSFSSQYVLNGRIQNTCIYASLFEKTPNRSSSEIWESFLS